MADVTINGLTATTTAVAADEIPIWVTGSSVTRKITRSNFLSGYAAITSGVWTPVLRFGGASTGITYSVQSGTYERNGNVLHFWMQISLSSKGSATGTATIAGLPVSQVGVRPTMFAYWSLASAAVVVFGQVAGTTINLFYTTAAATGPSLLTDTVFGNTSILYLSGAYQV